MFPAHVRREREFVFDEFMPAMDFVNKVAKLAEDELVAFAQGRVVHAAAIDDRAVLGGEQHDLVAWLLELR